MAVTQKQSIKDHLVKHGSITSWDAIQMYNATRLSSIIHRLKHEGMRIVSEDTINPVTKVRFSTYYYSP